MAKITFFIKSNLYQRPAASEFLPLFLSVMIRLSLSDTSESTVSKESAMSCVTQKSETTIR